MSKKSKAALTIAVLAVALFAAEQLGCLSIKRSIVGLMTPEYNPEATAAGGFVPVYDKLDEPRDRIAISLVPIATGLIQPTDVQFVPGQLNLLIALQKGGQAIWHDLAAKRYDTFFEIEVLSVSEQGLLGLAFHPKFSDNGQFFVNATVKSEGNQVTQVARWSVPPGSDLRTVKPKRDEIVLEVAQPYPNHNAGQLAFGPDGFLYIGFGDGGWADDPHNHGQDKTSLLGTMMRIDVDTRSDGKNYGIPADNPFIGEAGVPPETWAIGLRNPWRYSFAPDGRLFIADVGQDSFEEVTILAAGENAGWKHREARHCFDPEEDCRTDGLVEPIYEYGREDGGSITGGFVSTTDAVPSLENKYVFADFLSGRIWALDPPNAVQPNDPLAKVYSLGRWPFLPSTFAQDDGGQLYVAGYRSGTIWRIEGSP